LSITEGRKREVNILFDWENFTFAQSELSALCTLLAQTEGHESLLKSSLRLLFLFPKTLNKILHFFLRGYIKRSKTHFPSINLFLIDMNVTSYDGKIGFYSFRKEFIAQIFYYAKYVNLFIIYKYYKKQFSIKCVCIQQNGRKLFLGISSSV